MLIVASVKKALSPVFCLKALLIEANHLKSPDKASLTLTVRNISPPKVFVSIDGDCYPNHQETTTVSSSYSLFNAKPLGQATNSLKDMGKLGLGSKHS